MPWKGALRCAPSPLLHAFAAPFCAARATAVPLAAAPRSLLSALATATLTTHTGVIVPTRKALR